MWFVMWASSRIFIDFDTAFTGGHWAISYGSSGGGADTNGHDITSTPVVENEWTKIEWYLKKNTTGSNGILRLWINGALAWERTNLTFPPGDMTTFYDEGTNNGYHYPLPSSPRIIADATGPVDAYRWTSVLRVSAP